MRQDAIEPACEILSGSLADLRTVCGRLVPLFLDTITADYCVANIGPFVGDRGSCAGITQPYSRAACLGHADYADDARGADPAVCAASPFCRMMKSGRPEDCEPFLKDLARDACRGRYNPEHALKQGGAAAAEVDGVLKEIDALENPTLDDDELTEKAIRLLRRWKPLEERARNALKPSASKT